MSIKLTDKKQFVSENRATTEIAEKILDMWTDITSDDGSNIEHIMKNGNRKIVFNTKGMPDKMINNFESKVYSYLRSLKINSGLDYKGAIGTLIFESKFVNEAKIKSDADFKDYAFAYLKNAFGDKFDDAIANKVVDGLTSKYSGNYGAMIGALTSKSVNESFTNRTFITESARN